jgi:membrane-associated phospholipid phosphatase
MKRSAALARFALILSILLISSLIFATLAEDILNHETFYTLDPLVGAWLIARTTLPGDRVFSLITLLGNAVFISSSTGILGLWFAKRRRWGKLGFLFVCVGGAAALNLLLKFLVARPRPDFAQAYGQELGSSFPSGHAMISIAFYGALAFLLFVELKRWRQKVLVISGVFAIAALVGFSRLYLGVHYLSDILAGWAAGALWLALCILAERLVAHKHGPFVNSRSGA